MENIVQMNLDKTENVNLMICQFPDMQLLAYVIVQSIDKKLDCEKGKARVIY